MGCVGIVGGVGIVVADCCKGWHQVLVLVLLGVVCAPSTPCTPPQGGGGGPPLHATNAGLLVAPQQAHLQHETE